MSCVALFFAVEVSSRGEARACGRVRLRKRFFLANETDQFRASGQSSLHAESFRSLVSSESGRNYNNSKSGNTEGKNRNSNSLTRNCRWYELKHTRVSTHRNSNHGTHRSRTFARGHVLDSRTSDTLAPVYSTCFLFSCSTMSQAWKVLH